MWNSCILFEGYHRQTLGIIYITYSYSNFNIYDKIIGIVYVLCINCLQIWLFNRFLAPKLQNFYSHTLWCTYYIWFQRQNPIFFQIKYKKWPKNLFLNCQYSLTVKMFTGWESCAHFYMGFSSKPYRLWITRYFFAAA